MVLGLNNIKAQDHKFAKITKEGLHAKMTDNKGSYKYLIQQMGDKIILMSVKEFNTGMILPNQYPELKELYSQMIAKNKEQIVLEKI